MPPIAYKQLLLGAVVLFSCMVFCMPSTLGRVCNALVKTSISGFDITAVAVVGCEHH